MLTIAIQGSFEEAKLAIEEANKKGEAIELRLDLLKDLEYVSKLKSLCKLPVIFTLRKKDQGGNGGRAAGGVSSRGVMPRRLPAALDFP